ncbi:MAG: hypothetical protein WC393_00470 [Candidatus Nanoarchaeia archaeon]|jgi:hypothetical protein
MSKINLIEKAKELFKKYDAIRPPTEYTYDWLCKNMIRYSKDINAKKLEGFNQEHFEIIVWMHNLGRYVEKDDDAQGVKHAKLGVDVFDKEFVKTGLITDEKVIKKIKTCILYHSIKVYKILKKPNLIKGYEKFWPEILYPELQILRESNYAGYFYNYYLTKETVKNKIKLFNNLIPKPSKKAKILAKNLIKKYYSFRNKAETLAQIEKITIPEAIKKLLKSEK